MRMKTLPICLALTSLLLGGCADKPSRPAEPVADRYRDSGQHRSCPAGTSGPLSISWGWYSYCRWADVIRGVR